MRISGRELMTAATPLCPLLASANPRGVGPIYGRSRALLSPEDLIFTRREYTFLPLDLIFISFLLIVVITVVIHSTLP